MPAPMISSTALAITVRTHRVHATGIANMTLDKLSVYGNPAQVSLMSRTGKRQMRRHKMTPICASGITARLRDGPACAVSVVMMRLNPSFAHHWHVDMNNAVAFFDRATANPICCKKFGSHNQINRWRNVVRGFG